MQLSGKAPLGSIPGTKTKKRQKSDKAVAMESEKNHRCEKNERSRLSEFDGDDGFKTDKGV